MNRGKIIFIALVAVLMGSCSPTRVLSDGQYLLDKNTIKVDDKRFNASSLNSYVIQKPNSKLLFGYTPAVYFYGMAGKSESKGAEVLRKIGEAPVVYDAALVSSSVDNLKKHLNYLGWFGSEVESRVEVKKKKVKVTYFVTLGRQIPISSVTYDIPDGDFAKDFAADIPNITVKAGDYLSEAAAEQESKRSAAHFRTKGYYSLSPSNYFFEADTLADPTRADLTMSIRPYNRGEDESASVPVEIYHIGNVTYSLPKNLKFRKSQLEMLNLLRPGQVYDSREVDKTYNRFASVPLFNSVAVTTTSPENGTVDVDVALGQSRLQAFKINLEASVNSTGLFGISPQLTYTHKNIFHGGEVLNVGVKGNFQFGKDKVSSQEFSTNASLTFPQFLGLPGRWFKGANVPRTEFGGAFSYQNRPEFERTVISTKFGYTGSFFNGHLFYQINPFQLSITRLFNLTDDFFVRMISDPFLLNAYADNFDMGVGMDWYYTSNTSANPKGSYHFLRFSTDISGNLLSLFNKYIPYSELLESHVIWDTPYSQYVRGELQAGRAIAFGKNLNHAIAYRFIAGIGYAYGNSYTVPFDQQFFCGGSSSMRGWQSRTLGPGTSTMVPFFIIPNQTGDMKLEANLEYRFPIFKVLHGALFVDAGNVWSIGKYAYEDEKFSFSTFYKAIAMDWGLGLRVDLNFILVRLDLGLRVHDPARSEGDRWVSPAIWFPKNYALHFGVGYPF